jgi:DNA N-6-adenine-methyltransferase (Dam)
VSTLFDVTATDVADTNDEWYTPSWIFKAAGIVFDLDVAAPVDPARRTCPARHYLTVLEDGLTQPWDGVVWCNPPYSGPGPWARRFAAYPDGLALLPLSNSRWRGDLLASADAMCLLSVYDFGRPNDARSRLRFPVILAARGPVCVAALARVAAADPYTAGAYHVRPDAP